MVFSRICLHIPTGFPSLGFQPKCCVNSHITMPTTCPNHLILLYLMILIFDDPNTIWRRTTTLYVYIEPVFYAVTDFLDIIGF
jgi:hypothetical protein